MGNKKYCCVIGGTLGFLGLAGTFFFLFPLFLSSLALSAAARLSCRLTGGCRGPAAFFAEINRVSLDMLNNSLFAKTRCAASGRLFRSSPALAGAVYRYFNVVCLGAAWALLLSGAAAL